jgi:hypothetical protein
MLGARLFLLRVCVLHVVILLEGSSAGAAENKAVVAGAPTNLRAGAGVDLELKTTLKEGDQVSVEKLEGEWYQVTAADGQTGYIHNNLLKLGGEAPSPVVAQKAVIDEIGKPTKESISTAAATRQAAAGTPTAQRSKPSAAKPPAAPVAPEEQSAATGKSPSILQMLEGHEKEIMIATAVVAAFFFVGWICGGNYYLRRDRKRRNKIRF